jgi:hypothetical protein
LKVTLFYYAVFIAVDYMTAVVAFMFEKRENWRLPALETVRDAYQLHRLRERNPRMPLMPGDTAVELPTYNATRAVSIEAAPEEIWPWIVQMGVGRAGWYSYDWIDNLGRKSAGRSCRSFSW